MKTVSTKPIHRRPAKTAGFLLFEIILALSVFSIVILALARGMQMTLDSMSMALMESYVREQLASRISLTQVQPPVPGEYQEPSPDTHRVSYTRTITPLSLRTKNGIQLPRFYEVQWTATWTDPGGERSKTYQIYLYDDGTASR